MPDGAVLELEVPQGRASDQGSESDDAGSQAGSASAATTVAPSAVAASSSDSEDSLHGPRLAEGGAWTFRLGMGLQAEG